MNQALHIQTQQQFLSIALSQEHWALLPTVQLVEILQIDFSSIAEIPGMPAAVMGVYPTAPSLLWIVDLVQLSGLNSTTVPKQCSVLKINTQWGSLGYFVRQVGKLMTIDSTAIERPDASTVFKATIPHLPETCQQGIWRTPQGKTLPILNTEAIAKYSATFSTHGPY